MVELDEKGDEGGVENVLKRNSRWERRRGSIVNTDEEVKKMNKRATS